MEQMVLKQTVQKVSRWKSCTSLQIVKCPRLKFCSVLHRTTALVACYSNIAAGNFGSRSVQRVGLSPVQQPAEKSSGKLTRTEPRIAVLVRRAKQGGCAASGQNKMAVAAESNIAVAFI